jgi:hypothetical protein
MSTDYVVSKLVSNVNMIHNLYLFTLPEVMKQEGYGKITVIQICIHESQLILIFFLKLLTFVKFC